MYFQLIAPDGDFGSGVGNQVDVPSGGSGHTITGGSLNKIQTMHWFWFDHHGMYWKLNHTKNANTLLETKVIFLPLPPCCDHCCSQLLDFCFCFSCIFY
jgi:hypothetical protein